MTDYKAEMTRLLSEADTDFIGDTIDETGFYKASLESLSGTGSGMRKMAWGAVFFFCVILFIALWQLFVATDLRTQIIWAAIAVMTNSAQIAFKMWFNMQLNRRAISHEIRRLQLAVMAKGA